MDKATIKVDRVSKTFKLPHEKQSSVKGMLINLLRGSDHSYEKLQALKNVSFEVKTGEFFGIVGPNGSGKSTLLKLLAGIYASDQGTIQVNGKLTPFIELGVGFNPELTGRENVFLNGALLGFSRKEMQAMYQDIVGFAELERFMDQKLKNYSSGMQVRLAFSIAIKVNSDILLLDEVLAVGDASFQKKCYDYFRRLKKEKKTVVFISHDMSAVRQYCERAIVVDKGRVIFSGAADKAADVYTQMFMLGNKVNKKNIASEMGERWGSQDAVITDVDIHVTPSTVTITMPCEFKKNVKQPVFGLTIHSAVGTKIYESNSKWQKVSTGAYEPGDTATVVWNIDNIFTNGENVLSVAIANSDATEFYDNWENAASFTIDKDLVTTAVALPASSIEIKR